VGRRSARVHSSVGMLRFTSSAVLTSFVGEGVSVMRPSPVPTGSHCHKAGAERLSREPRQRCPEGSPKGRPWCAEYGC
jgi:hypothetical protein